MKRMRNIYVIEREKYRAPKSDVAFSNRNDEKEVLTHPYARVKDNTRLSTINVWDVLDVLRKTSLQKGETFLS